ncbi:hypothetical protein ACFCY8_33825 [Streptomyces noursei]|uniref:hypothetical protein n=1 Tax=Streptomyces noursei TaxID=1971 RepID=UPI0035E0073F
MLLPKPLLLLDVDGVLNPLRVRPGQEPDGFRRHFMRPRAWIDQHPHLLESDVPDLPVWLHPDHGEELLDLPYDLVWATTWENDANHFIGPAIGLPSLPVITWTAPHAYPADGTYFKTADIVRYAAGRPFAWVDDQLGQADRDYVARHHPGPALLYDTDDATGLDLDDFEALAQWTDTISAST